MAVAKIARSNFGKLKKKVKKVTGRLFAPPSKVPGRIDYPTIPEALKAQKRRKKLLGEIGK